VVSSGQRTSRMISFYSAKLPRVRRHPTWAYVAKWRYEPSSATSQTYDCVLEHLAENVMQDAVCSAKSRTASI
jgi:hypothetical protein